MLPKIKAAVWLVPSVLTITLFSAGCGMSGITSGLGSGGIFGPKKSETSWAPVTEQGMLQAARVEGGPVDMTAPGSASCPHVNAANAEKVITVYEGGRDSLSIVHRGEISRTARECDVQPGRVAIKYGFGGRVLLGPKGKAGIVTLPVTVSVTDRAQNRVKSEVVRVQVQISPDEPVGYFSVVRQVDIPIAPGAGPQDYRVIVAFEQRVPGAG